MRILTFILLLLTLGLQAQEPVHYFFNEDDGLPSSTVYDIMQDNQGYIWLGTEKGLVKYDGHHFKVYRTESQRGANCTDLVEGGSRIWCTNFARQIFYVENDTLHELGLWNGADKQGVLDIDYNDTDSCLYVGCGAGIYKLDLTKNTSELITPPNQTTAYIWRLLVKDGSVYGLNSKTHAIYRNGELKSWLNKTDSTAKYADAIQNYKGKVLVTYVDEAYWFEFGENGLQMTDMPTHLPEGNTVPSACIRLDDRGQLWLSRKEELFIQSKIFPLDDTGFNGIKDVSVSEVITDKEGQYWLSTLDKGVMVIPDINIWRHPIQDVKDLVVNSQGLFGLTSKNIQPLAGVGEAISLPKGIEGVNRVWHDEPSNTWLVSAKGFYIIRGGHVRMLQSVGSVKDVMVLGDTLYCATNLGPRYLLLNNLKEDASIPLVEGRYYAIAPGKGGLLAGSDIELKWISYPRPNEKLTIKELDNALYVTDILFKKNGEGVIATQGSAQLRMYADAKGEPMTSHMHLGVNAKNFTRLASYGEWLFAVCDEGILTMTEGEGKPGIISKADGLPTTDISSIAVYNERVYLATSKGLISFPADIKGENEVTPPIHARLEGKRGNKFEYNDNNFHFELFSGTYKHNGLLKFKYRLKGWDEDWIETDFNTPIVGYRKMRPGEYVFEAIAVNEDGLESDAPFSYSFTIETPFWKTWWFNLLMVASLVGATLVVALLITRSRRRKKDRENQAKLEQSRMKEEMTAYQLKALRAQMNPHFIFNALNTLQRYIMTNNKSEAGEYLGRFSDLMRKFLSMSESQNARLEDEIEMLRLYLDIEKERMKDDFTYTLNVSDKIDTEQVKIPSMLVQPIAENAIKHGLLHKKGEKHLKLDFTLKGNQLQITIEDNGVGRERSKEINAKREGHQSFGLKAVQSRIDLINQTGSQKAELVIEDLKGEDGKGVGTRVVLVFT